MADPTQGRPDHAVFHLMATSDIHANLLPYDYFADAAEQPYGLARLATRIKAVRDRSDNTLLVDNGDMLQGTPLSDFSGPAGAGQTASHPIIEAMNALGYDAACFGNHEFNFGLEWLRDTIGQANFPYVTSNLAPTTEGDQFWASRLLLRRQVTCRSGAVHPLTIGLIGLVPPQILTWDRHHLQSRVTCEDMVAAATRLVPALRAEGADLVLVLAHTGIGSPEARPMMENAALPLSRIPGIDGLVTGHTHNVFPGGKDMIPLGERVDGAQGALNGTATVMPGFRGSHLGLIEFDLLREAGEWRLARTTAKALPAALPHAPAIAVDRAFSERLEPAHRATLSETRRSIGTTEAPLHSYLSLLGHNPAERLVAEAQRRALARHVKDSPLAELPILSSVAPFKTGGRGGPGYYTDIPAGPLALRHAADLYAFPNTLIGALMTGAELRHWLDCAALVYLQITPGARDAKLCNFAAPGHIFEVIDGLSYEIDLAKPPRFDLCGAELSPGQSRIHALCHAGQPLRDADRFLVATNHYRAAGSGPFPAIPPERCVIQSQELLRDLLIYELSEMGHITAPTDPVWRFRPMPGTTVICRSGPGLRHVPVPPGFDGMELLGLDEDGFQKIRLPL
ncbi:bifunctional 2',3'-cyclic-nucleotide 2'-phosphodiesterase/3'-nucleotidase [Roseovarius sp. C7]|uniref:bifunctional 2',3'-cyclic-nucleotide 2'-phosphodiesterase/3'-nucleotidase n=1 Tax=Roseovarius sp. C7 TaxID=3398643 RepID=UPI0039F652BD